MRISKKDTQTSSPLVWLALVVTVALTVWVSIQDDETSESEVGVTISQQTHQLRSSDDFNSKPSLKTVIESSESELKPLQFRVINADAYRLNADLFKPYQAPQPLVAKKSIKEVLPTPIAPRPPFQYIGKLEESEQTDFFLMSGNKVLTVKKGAIIDRQWQLLDEDIQNIRLNYLPLSQIVLLSKTTKSVNKAPIESTALIQGM